jgi:outer membrane cobalamin receptor
MLSLRFYERLKYIVAGLALQCGLGALAAEEQTADSVLTLREVAVTAKVPIIATVQKLQGAELQSLSTTSIADALKYFAGVQIKDYGGLGGVKTLNVRSLGAQHVGVYIDGIRITNAQNGTVDLGKFSLSTLESVSLYNANKLETCQSASEYASGATVYLRTRRPTADSLSATVRWASFSTYSGRVNLQFARKGWSGFVDGEYLNSRGDYRFRYHSEYEDTVGRRTNSDIEYGRVEAALFKGGFASHLYYYASQRGCPGGIVRRLSDRYTDVGREWDRDLFVQASYQKKFSPRHSVKFNLKYSNEYLRYSTDYPENQNTARVNNHYRTNDAYASAAYTYAPLRWLWVNLSYDARMSWLNADLKQFHPVRRADQKGVVALQANYRRLSVAGSLLYQHYRDFTAYTVGAARPLSKLTPAISLSYNLGPVALRGWYKSIFRAPTLNDLYYTQVGNRNLKPEFTKQLNLGAEYHLQVDRWGLGVQADVYQNSVTNRIVCLPQRGTYTWTMLNYGKTFCRGLNSTISLRYTLRRWHFSLLNSLTWQRDLNRTDPEDEDTYNKPICYSPTFSYGLTAVVGWQQLTLTLSQLHVGPRMWSYADPADQLSAYNNVDLKLQYARAHWCAALEINDLFDVQYEHIPRYPMPGRNFRVSLTYSL